MREEELKTRLQAAVDNRLSALEGDPWLARRIMTEAKGEQPVVKKKLTVSLALVLALMLLTLSAAVALVQSNIAGMLFGAQENAPQTVLESIHTPQVTAGGKAGTLTLDEWLYDGSALHTSFTIANPGEEALLYTLEGIWLGDEHLTYDRINTEGAGDSGFLLGGQVNGAAMPGSKSIYHMGQGLHRYDRDGKYLGPADLPEGENKLRIAVAVWRPVNPVELVDYRTWEGVDTTETKDHLTVDKTGYSCLWMFNPKAFTIGTTAKDLPSEKWAEAYSEMGWMELVDTIEVEVDVNLSRAEMARAVPESMELSQGDCRIVFDKFDMTLSGGSMEGWIQGDEEAVRTLISGGLHVLDPAGQRVISAGCWWDDQPQEGKGLHFGINLAPMTGELPEAIQLVHIVAVDNRWDENEACYDPTLEKPENVVGMYQIDDRGAVTIPMIIQ